MTDYINKKVNFQYSKISVKITKKIYFINSSKVYLCVDNNNPQINYCLKISSARSDDKIACNSISSEILTMVLEIFNLAWFKIKTKCYSDYRLQLSRAKQSNNILHSNGVLCKYLNFNF
jgi:hypothetical protein